MSEPQPTDPGLEIEKIEDVIQKPETAIPYALHMEKKEIIDLFRGDNPGQPETKRLVTLWMEEARKSVEGFEVDSTLKESMLRAAQENLFTVANLARWDKTVDPEAIAKYNAWQIKMEEWVLKGDELLPRQDAPKSDEAFTVGDPEFFEINIQKQRRQILFEIARADVYLSVEDADEAYNCLDQAVALVEQSQAEYFNEITGEIELRSPNADLALVAEDKIAAITKVLIFLNQNAKKSE